MPNVKKKRKNEVARANKLQLIQREFRVILALIRIQISAEIFNFIIWITHWIKSSVSVWIFYRSLNSSPEDTDFWDISGRRWNKKPVTGHAGSRAAQFRCTANQQCLLSLQIYPFSCVMHYCKHFKRRAFNNINMHCY